jgi:SAM-dependent methyltransferase
MSRGNLDEAKATGFSERMLDILNGSALALMTSLGHRAGLFDTMAGRPASTSREIADAAGLDERYVREWLGAMLTGRIVEYDPDKDLYWLPPEHAACLTRAAGPDNLAVQMQYIAMLGAVESKILDCFREGGGVPYAEFERFHEVMAEDSGAAQDAALIDTTLPLVPGLIERLRRGIDILDLGCGSGHVANLIAEAFPKSRVTGFDFSSEGVECARAEARAQNLENARFEVRDATHLGDADAFDLVIASDTIHDQAAPAAVLADIARVLRTDGVFLMVDVAASSLVHENLDHPLAPFLYTVSCMHCMTVSLALGGAGLGAMWGEQKACEMLAAAGFGVVEVRHLDGDATSAYYLASKR